MIIFRADTRARNLQNISRMKKQFEEELNKQYRKRVFMMFADLLRVSPQYSGDFVSNWHIRPETSAIKGYTPWRNKGKVIQGRKWSLMGQNSYESALQAGHPEAVNFALTRSKFVKFDYRQRVHFTNQTNIQIDATTVTADGVTHNLRPVNLMSPPQQIFSYLRSKYPASKR